jgi:DNA polymerase-3 subunit alpha
LIEGAVVTIDARLAERDEAVSVIADRVATLDVVAGVAPIVLKLPLDAVTAPLVADLKRVLSDHPGSRPVHLMLVSAGRKSPVIDLADYAVDGSDGFMGDVKQLLGAGALGQLT